MVNFYKPQTGNDGDRFNAIVKAEEDAALREMSTFTGQDPLSVREREEEGVAPKMPNHKSMTLGQRRENRNFNRDILLKLISSKKLRGKSSMITLLLVLFGGGGFMTAFFSPSLAIIQMKEVFTKSFNDQLHSVEERSAILMRAKMKDLTKGSCGAIKIKCRFATMTDKQVAKFKAAGIEIERDSSKSMFPNRGQITKMTFTDDKGVKIAVTNAGDLQKTLIDNVPFRAAMTKGYNPLFATLSDKTVLNVMRKLKVSKGIVTTGETDEERQKKINDVVSGVEDSGAKTIITKTDENNKEHYFDSDGNELTKAEVDAAREQSDRITDYSRKGGTSAVLSGAVKGASIVGYMDSACTVYNSLRFVSALAKVKQEAMAARYAMGMVLTPADSIKAGDAQEGDVNFVGTNLTTVRLASNVIDESKLNQPNSAAAPAQTKDPEAGMNAFDGPGFRMAEGDAPDLSLRASRFMIGGGSPALLNGVLQAVAAVVNLGDPNPQKVSEKCGYIQNPVVRFTGLAVGIVAGIGTFGLSTALGIGGSIGFALMLPYIEARGADILAGNGFQNLVGIDSGDFAAVGTVAFLGSIAKARGMKPATAAEGMKYAAANEKSYNEYAATQQYLARATPFDINNPYSFMGSVAGTLVPIAQRSKSSASAAMMNITSLIPTSFASLTKTAKAGQVKADGWYEKCNDIGYKSLGLGADPFCGMHYILPEEDLAIDPLNNIDWMVANNEIDPETGEAKPEGGPVQDGNWSYAKFMNECPNRTVGWGEDQDENQGNGFNCIDPAKEEKNKHYRIYTMDKSIDESMDGEVATAGDTNSSSQDDESTAISIDGWAYPVLSNFSISSGFETSERPDHHGVDLAGKSTDETLGAPIFAARDGKVVAAGPADGYGNWIIIEHDINGKKVSTLYGHMYDNGVLVKVGDTVKTGQKIGVVGSKGNSTGPHLHFEVWNGSPLSNGKQSDPTPIINAIVKNQGRVREVINV